MQLPPVPAAPPTARLFDERAVADGEDRVAEASDVRDGAAEPAPKPARDAAVEPADGLVVAEHTVADGEGAGGIHDGAAEAGAAGAGAGRPADGLVVEERAVADGGRGRCAGVPVDMMAPPSAELPVLPEVPSPPMDRLWTKVV